ncbi:MAG: DUF962 domain-containing protein [Gammaproteobacteria bacterium]|nr:DUF962 domain-containing protein [Gammaproteobacteria bacterium]MDH5628741.1 DUF962 domain-containing protein [Gammaproteobacteria bacterium]
MKSAQEQLSTYKSVHLNRKNITTHFVGIPLIMWAIAVLMSLVSVQIPVSEAGYKLTLAKAFFSIAIIYYFILHWRLAIGITLFILPMVYCAEIISGYDNGHWIAILVFVIGWVFQFIGHYYEKAKPAFVDDLNQLMIGPFFMMAEVYFLLGLCKGLNEEITPMAVEKRRAFEAKSAN